MIELLAKCCVNCHFFCQHTLGSMHPVCERDRTDMRDSVEMRIALLYRSKENPPSLECAKGVWSDTDKAMKMEEAAVARIVALDRNDICFFHRHAPDVSIAVAKELERRAADRREAERDRALTREMLRIATRNLSIVKWIGIGSILVGIASIIVACMKK